MSLICIYALRDPRDLAACYVGYTGSPKARLRQHCGFVEVTTAKEAWICGLREIGREPTIDVLDKVSPEVQHRRDAEDAMIMQYVAKGCPLMNLRAGSGDSYALGRHFTVDEMVFLAEGGHPREIFAAAGK